MNLKIKGFCVDTPAQAASLFCAALPKVQNEERFFVLPLDVNGEVLAKPILISVGHQDGTTVVDPKEVFKAAFKVGADAFIVAHNHPSGNLTPSESDLRLTEELKSRAEWLGLELLDHIIITLLEKPTGKLRFCSIAEVKSK